MRIQLGFKTVLLSLLILSLISITVHADLIGGGYKLIHQGGPIADVAEHWDAFGSVGVPYEDVGVISNAGAVNIIYGDKD
jgi:hypothetical protein